MEIKLDGDDEKEVAVSDAKSGAGGRIAFLNDVDRSSNSIVASLRVKQDDWAGRPSCLSR